MQKEFGKGHMMTIVVTMAGLGTRFKEAGYDIPKYKIKAKGKTLFEWSMESLLGYLREENVYIFIVRKEDEARRLCWQENYGIKKVAFSFII